MKLLNKDLQKLIDLSSQITFWIDYLRLNLSFNNIYTSIYEFFRIQIKKLDTDNSNFLYLNMWDNTYTAQKIKLSNGTGLIFSLSYYEVVVPCFIYVEYSPAHQKQFQSFWKLDFYWSFFRLKDLKKIEEKFYINDIFQEMEISRLDWRIDLFEYKYWNIPHTKIQARSNSFLDTHKTAWKINSWRYWNKANKTLLVRWYDKKLDIESKWKFRLFWDYQQYKSVFRLEWEFLNLFCKGYKLKNLEEIIKKAYKYCWLDSVSFVWKFLHTYEKIDLTDEFEKRKYCNTMLWYIKNALKNWVNVYDLIDVELEKSWFSELEVDMIKNKCINISDKQYLFDNYK